MPVTLLRSVGKACLKMLFVFATFELGLVAMRLPSLRVLDYSLMTMCHFTITKNKLSSKFQRNSKVPELFKKAVLKLEN